MHNQARIYYTVYRIKETKWRWTDLFNKLVAKKRKRLRNKTDLFAMRDALGLLL